jgi:hypothetical protein
VTTLFTVGMKAVVSVGATSLAAVGMARKPCAAPTPIIAMMKPTNTSSSSHTSTVSATG